MVMVMVRDSRPRGQQRERCQAGPHTSERDEFAPATWQDSYHCHGIRGSFKEHAVQSLVSDMQAQKDKGTTAQATQLESSAARSRARSPDS